VIPWLVKMRGIHTFFILFGVLLAYLFLVNAVADFLVQSPLAQTFSSGSSEESSSSFDVKIGMSDQVSIKVERQRFYGKIIETAFGDHKILFLYLFNFLKLPIQVDTFHFLYVHVAMIILLFALMILFSRLETRE